MASHARDMSLSQLERLLSSKKSELEGLMRARERLRKDLQQVELRISGLQGNRPAGPTGRRRRTGKRAQNPKPLAEVIALVLGNNKKGYPLGELAAKVREAGYKSYSSNFSNIVYQCIYNNRDRFALDSGHYTLK